MSAQKQGFFASLSSIFSGKKRAAPALYLPDPAVQPLECEEKEEVKAGFAGGKEYFLFAGDIHPRHQLPELLKAFSQFKKWQRSEMKLLLAGRSTRRTASLEKLLETYKYRADVIMIKNPEPGLLNRLIAATYALVFTTSREEFSPHILNAMQARAPVISTKTRCIYQVAGDSILYAQDKFVPGAPPAGPEMLARHLVTLYRDEGFRRDLITKAAASVQSSGTPQRPAGKPPLTAE